MGVPTSEVGYISAMPRREDHEVHKDMWGHWGGGDIQAFLYAIMIQLVTSNNRCFEGL